MVGNDGYYHIRLADIMRQEGLTPGFKWLPLTILNPDAYYDHHLLYHVVLALFIPGDPLRPVPDSVLFGAAKWASVLIPAVVFMAIWYLLERQSVRWAWLWALALFAVSDAFLYRMSMVRAQAASLLVLILGLHWLLRRRYVYLMPLGFFYVWLYNAFPLLFIIAAVVFVATWITEGTLEWGALLYSAGGLALGLLVNPYFPQNLVFIWSHLLPKVGENISGLGIEWEPYETWTLVENSTGMLILLAGSMFALGWSRRRMDRSALVGMALMFVFGAMLLKSRRFVEYAPAFVLIFAALASRPMVERWLVGRERVERIAAAVILTLALMPMMGRSLMRARDQVQTSTPAGYMAEGARWLKSNIPHDTMIFQTDWDDFTRLFFYNPDSVYTVGLDPTYLQLADPDLYDLWVSITRGQVENPSPLIAEQFGAEYVFTDTRHEGFIEHADADPGLAEVYRDDDVVIYHVEPDR
jgi:hypothetical protein